MVQDYYIGTQVRRAWMTDPKIQFEVGTITAFVNDGTITSPDVEVIWSDGSITKELDCELMEVYAENGVYKYDILSEIDKKIFEQPNVWHRIPNGGQDEV